MHEINIPKYSFNVIFLIFYEKMDAYNKVSMTMLVKELYKSSIAALNQKINILYNYMYSLLVTDIQTLHVVK